jgi:nucleotide-binding universal stress UspA family protein
MPLDGSREAAFALDDTLKLAHRHQLEIVVLHIHIPATLPAFSDHEPHATRIWEREFLARHVPIPRDPVRLLRRFGVPAEDIVMVAQETRADVVVLAWSQNLAAGRARVVRDTLARSSLPVLLLPASTDALALPGVSRTPQSSFSPPPGCAPVRDGL